MKKYYRNDRRLSVKLASLLREIYLEFGLLPRIVAPLIGRYFHVTMKREEKRLGNGWTYESKTFCEKNPAALALENSTGKDPVNQTLKSFDHSEIFGKSE
jgi:hypothetical protein